MIIVNIFWSVLIPVWKLSGFVAGWSLRNFWTLTKNEQKPPGKNLQQTFISRPYLLSIILL